MIPIRREQPGDLAGAFQQAREVLDTGKVLAIFPEGTRTRTANSTAATPAPPTSRWRPAPR